MTENHKINNFPTRKPTRLQNYDYSQNGCYFVTVCVKNRKPILSTIVGAGFHARPSADFQNHPMSLKDGYDSA